MDFTQGRVIDSLNAQDIRNEELLDQVVAAADAVSSTDADVTTSVKDFEAALVDPENADPTARAYRTESDNYDRAVARGDTADAARHQERMAELKTQYANENGMIAYGGKVASLQGTGGVAMLEFAKDAIQTAVSNISGVGTNQMVMRKKVEQIMARG